MCICSDSVISGAYVSGDTYVLVVQLFIFLLYYETLCIFLCAIFARLCAVNR